MGDGPAMDMPKIWQTTIWFGDQFEESECIYGDSLSSLKTQVKEWFDVNQPKAFTNCTPSQTKKARYTYVFGTSNQLLSDLVKAYRSKLGNEDKGIEATSPEVGWYSADNEDGIRPQSHADFHSAVEHFIEHAFMPRKGPDYKEVGLNVSKFPLHLIRKVRKEDSEIEVNDLLQRGWYIIGLDFKGTETYRGEEVKTRTTIYVLGHLDENAI